MGRIPRVSIDFRDGPRLHVSLNVGLNIIVVRDVPGRGDHLAGLDPAEVVATLRCLDPGLGHVEPTEGVIVRFAVDLTPEKADLGGYVELAGEIEPFCALLAGELVRMQARVGQPVPRLEIEIGRRGAEPHVHMLRLERRLLARVRDRAELLGLQEPGEDRHAHVRVRLPEHRLARPVIAFVYRVDQREELIHRRLALEHVDRLGPERVARARRVRSGCRDYPRDRLLPRAHAGHHRVVLLRCRVLMVLVGDRERR